MENTMFTVIPKFMTGKEELVVLSRSIFDKLMLDMGKREEVLKWSDEAKELKSKGKLPLLRSLKDLR